MEKYTIYQIVCKNESIKETYIGSTVNLKDRISKHKYDCNNPNSKSYNAKVYQFMRLNGGFTNFKFIVLKEKECVDNYEAHRIEQQYITELKSGLNNNLSYTGLNSIEYKKQYDKQYNKQYYQENKQYYKQYRLENQKYLKQYNTQYKILNKNKLNEKYCCLICKGSYTYHNISKHEQSNKHKKHINHIL